MESLFDGIDYGFGSGFPELGDKKFNDTTQKRESSYNEKKIFDFGKNDSSSTSRDIEHDILNEIRSFSGIKGETVVNRSATNFDDNNFKYLLSKSPGDNDNKKSGKNKKETEEEEREKMQ